MSPETAAAVPQEISQNINDLHGKVETLQRELSQALDVWQTTLSDEKKKFEELLDHKVLAAEEQNSQWARQTQSYEERLAEMKSDFDARLKQTEQNAIRALAELDDAWQRDKLEWGPNAQADWPAQRRDLETQVQTLQARIQELESRPEPAAAAVPEALPGGPTPETVRALQAQLSEFQHTVSSLQNQAAHSDELVNACVQALDYQISVLYDLVYHFAPPAPEEGAASDLVQS
jgi:chromosome segregation ATPase